MNRILDILSKLGCLFLSFILFFVICLYLCLNLVPKIVIKENVKVLVNEVNIEDLIDNEENTLLSDLYKVAEENSVDKNIINGIINSKEFKEIISNYYGEMVEAILYNGKATEINVFDIINAIDKTLEDSVNNLGYTMTNEQKQIIMEQVENSAQKLVELFPTSEQIINNIGQENVKTIRALFGRSTKIFLITIIFIIVLIMALIRWSIYRFAIWSGVTTVVAGLIFMILGSFFYDIFLNTNYQAVSITVKNLIENNILKAVTNIGTTTLLIGVAQIAYYFIVKKSYDN